MTGIAWLDALLAVAWVVVFALSLWAFSKSRR